jgi:hypothetical protein
MPLMVRERAPIARDCAAAYRRSMAEFAGMRNLDVFYASFDVDKGLAEYDAAVDRTALRQAQQVVAKARTRDSMQALEKLTHIVDGEPQITPHPPLVVPARDLMLPEHVALFEDWMRRNLRAYRSTLQNDRRLVLEKFRFIELARKVGISAPPCLRRVRALEDAGVAGIHFEDQVSAKKCGLVAGKPPHVGVGPRSVLDIL